MQLFPEQQNSTTWEGDNFDHFTEVMTGNNTIVRENIGIQRNVEEVPIDSSFIPSHIKRYLGFNEIYLTYIGNSNLCARVTFDRSERIEKFNVKVGQILQMEIPIIDEVEINVSKIMLFRIHEVFDNFIIIGPLNGMGF